MSGRSLILTGEQIRAARAIARIGQAELASLCGLSLETIKRLEGIRGPVEANVRTINAIVEAFLRKSVVLESSEDGRVGVRLTGERPSFGAILDRIRPPTSDPEEAVYRLIYYSRAAPTSQATLVEVLAEIQKMSTLRNAELGVTGMLLAQNGWFLGALEGAKGDVQQVYGAISADSRHRDLQILQNRSVPRRQFSDWTIFCGLFASDDEAFAREPSMAGGFNPESLSPASALGVLAVAHDLESEAPRRMRGGWNPCRLGGQCLDRTCVASSQSHLDR